MSWLRAWAGIIGAAMAVVVLSSAAAADASYVVRPGDTLSGIASSYGVAVGDLAAANGVQNIHVIVVGRSLQIPGATVAPQVRAATVTPPAVASPTGTRSGSSLRYTVRAGDSFWAIASRFGIRASALAQANALNMTSGLHAGQVLAIPGVQLPANLPRKLPADLTANPDRLMLYPYFAAAAKQSGVPVDLLMATAYVESGWKQAAISPTGAVGVGQLLPDTSRWIAVVLLHEPRLDPANARDNIRMSARFLRYTLEATGWDVRRALASYYQGPGSVSRDGITPTGLTYAARIMAARSSFT